MTQAELQETEAAIRRECSAFGRATVDAILVRVRTIPETTDRDQFAASLTAIVHEERRLFLDREQDALRAKQVGLDAMEVLFPRGPAGLH